MLIDQILSETSCFFTVFKYLLKNYLYYYGLTYAISVVNWIFGEKNMRNNCLFFFTDFKLLLFPDNIVNITESFNKWNLLKFCIQTTYPIDFCIICSLLFL